jgi:hypothetical protein
MPRPLQLVSSRSPLVFRGLPLGRDRQQGGCKHPPRLRLSLSGRLAPASGLTPGGSHDGPLSGLQ